MTMTVAQRKSAMTTAVAAASAFLLSASCGVYPTAAFTTQSTVQSRLPQKSLSRNSARHEAKHGSLGTITDENESLRTPLHISIRPPIASPSADRTTLRMSAVEDVIKEKPDSSMDEEVDVPNMQGIAIDTEALTAPVQNSTFMSKIQEKIGSIDEKRLAFPEYSSGEVPRLYSNLKYVPKGSNGVSASHAPGSVIGAAALVAGTTIGAGVIALPTATAPAGFLPSSAALCVAWFYMTATGLLISELSINRIGETGRPGIGILDLYKNSLGKNYSFIATAAFFFLHYSVMVAYFAKAGSYVGSFLDSTGLEGMAQNPALSQFIFAGTIASFLYFLKPSAVEKVNNALVLGVAATFVSIISIGASTADFGALVALKNQHPEEVVNAFPILFLVMVFHNVVPTVVRQLEGDRKKITTAIVSGTALPLVMFLAWNAVILGNVVGSGDVSATDFDPIALIENGQNGEVLGGLVSVFTELAIVTSLVGFVYGLVDAITDIAGLPTNGPNYEKWRPALYAGVFVPPLVFAMTNPYVFMDALEYGGAFGVSTLFLVLPSIMIWKERYGDEEKPITVKPMVPGGKITLGSIWKAAGTLIVEQGAEKLGIIDFFRELLSK